MTIIFEIAIKKHVKFLGFFHFTKVLTKPSLKGSASLSIILHTTINFSSSYNEVQSISLKLIMENCLSITGDVMVVLVRNVCNRHTSWHCSQKH